MKRISRKDKARYELLDDIGFLGTQEELTPAQRKYIQKKTGEFFRKARAASAKVNASNKKRIR